MGWVVFSFGYLLKKVWLFIKKRLRLKQHEGYHLLAHNCFSYVPKVIHNKSGAFVTY